jgi:hypothetical protein
MITRWLVCSFLLVSFFGHAQERQTLKPKAISKLLPVKVQGYRLERDSKSSILTIGTLRYSLCERIFSDGDRIIKILLFDYAEAPIMLNQSVKKWDAMEELETDSVTFAKRTLDYGQVWESSHPRSQRSQLLLSVNNRFFLTLEAEHVTPEALSEFFTKNINLSIFPK